MLLWRGLLEPADYCERWPKQPEWGEAACFFPSEQAARRWASREGIGIAAFIERA